MSEDCKLPMRFQIDNAMMALGFGIPQLAVLEASIRTRQQWRTIKYTTNGSMSAGQIAQDALWAYGIDTVLLGCQFVCVGDGVGVESRKSVPGKMHWMADHLLRQYAMATGAFTVDSAPVKDKRGRSSASGVTGRMWKPWGVPARPKSFDGVIMRIFSRAYGSTMDDTYKRLARHSGPGMLDELKRELKQSLRG